MSLKWRGIGLLAGTVLFVLGMVGAAVLLGLNLHYQYKLDCSFFEGSLDCMDDAEYRDGYSWTWRGYSTALGLALAGAGLTYLCSTPRHHRLRVKQKTFDFAAILWIALIIAGFACLFSSYYLTDHIDPLWGWQNWYVYVVISGLESVPWLLWTVAFGLMFIFRSEWVVSRRRAKEIGSPSDSTEEKLDQRTA